MDTNIIGFHHSINKVMIIKAVRAGVLSSIDAHFFFLCCLVFKAKFSYIYIYIYIYFKIRSKLCTVILF